MNNRMTIVQLVPELHGGGVERGTLEVANELVARGHRSIVISRGGRLVRPLVEGGSEHIEWPIGRKSPLTLGCVLKLRNWLKQQQIDILHARSRIPAWVARLALDSLPHDRRPKFVTTVHGMYSVNRYSRIMTRGEVVIAVSHAVREYIKTNYLDCPVDQIKVIHRGINPAEFPHGFTPSNDWQTRWSNESPELNGKHVLTLAGRITRLKGHHDFLKLITDLKSAGESVHGLIVGGEDPRRTAYAAELRSTVERLGLEQDVTFLGHRSDVREIYAISSIVLSLSTQPESFGRTTLEPLALGIPVVGYDHGGVGEILRTVFSVGAVPVGVRSILKDRVRMLINSPTRRVPAFDQFTLQEMLNQELSLYERLVSPRESIRRAA